MREAGPSEAAKAFVAIGKLRAVMDKKRAVQNLQKAERDITLRKKRTNVPPGLRRSFRAEGGAGKIMKSRNILMAIISLRQQKTGKYWLYQEKTMKSA